MSLETQIANLVAATNQLTGEVSGKMAAINQTVDAKKADLDAWRGGHLSEHPALAVNFNASMLTLSGAAPQQVPVGMGLNAGGNFWDKFDMNIINVASGAAPESRPAVVRELLQYMGCDRQHFSMHFNIVELTVKSLAGGINSYVFFIPYRHVKLGAFHSVTMYHKVVGQGNWGWMDNAKKNVWNQVTHHGLSYGDAGGYFHVDVGVDNPAVGDKLYLALPQVVLGKWNPEQRAPQMLNVYDMILDAVPTGSPTSQL